MTFIHCVCHRLALACKAAAASVAYVQKWFDITEALGRHYDFSGKAKSQLEETQLGMGETAVKLVMSAFTRWLSHDSVTSMMYRRLACLLVDLHVRSEGDAGDRGPAQGAWVKVGSPNINALGLFTAMYTVEWISMLCLMRDVLPVLAQLSQKMQSEDTDISCLVEDIPRARRMIEDQIANPGPCYEGRKATLRGCADAVGTAMVPRGHHSRTDVWLENQRVAYLQSLVAELKARYQDVPVCVALYRLFTAAKHPAAGATGPETMAHFKADVDLLVEKFSVWVDTTCPDDVPLPPGPNAAPHAGFADPNTNKPGFVQFVTRDDVERELALFSHNYTKACRAGAAANLQQRNDDRKAKLEKFKKTWKHQHDGTAPLPQQLPVHLTAPITAVSFKDCFALFFGGITNKMAFPTIYKLGCAAQIMLVESTRTERGFSAVAIAKTALQNSMGNKHLDNKLECYFNLSNRHLRKLGGAELLEASELQEVEDLKTCESAAIHWHYQDKPTDPDGEKEVQARRGGIDRGGLREMEGVQSDGFMKDLENRTNFLFGSSAIDINSLEASGTLIRTRARRDAQLKKRDFQPVPEAMCTRRDEVMETADREPLFDHIGRFCFPELGDMSPVVGDQVAHWFTDLATDEDAVVPGWANGKIKTLNRAAGTFTVLYSDGLEAERQELNVKDYGEDRVWVILMNTTADAANQKPARGGLV